MELALSSDDSCDSEIKNMKGQLSEFGLDEDNLSKEEMIDLLKALNNSKSSAKEDNLLRQKVEEPAVGSPKKTMKRRYLDVADRRMPWSVLPSTITQAEKARTLAVYIKLMSIDAYRQARLSPNFAPWPPGIQIVEETSTSRIQPIRSTRSGRSVPVYAGFDDDPSDLDFVVAKPKKIKTSHGNAGEGTSQRFISLKRKHPKEENARLIKESKLSTDNKLETVPKPNTRIETIFSLIED